MLRNHLYLALAAAFVLAPVASQASNTFVSRMVTAHDGAGRWVNRRLTLRHQGQDSPRVGRREDSFLSRMVSEPDEKGRWVNRRLTIRHEGQDRAHF